MASIPGFRFDITGASGTQGLLSPKGSWRAYILPRGAYAAQDSTGTLITFDTAAVASRFAANNWIQVGTPTANIRQVAAVGGNSISISGAAVTVTENDRIFIIGNTQPTVSGGSATYVTPNTRIYQRDDDGADLYTNSMITSNVDGLIQGYASVGIYDALVQDSNQANQGYIADMGVGVAEGISTSQAATFGATSTFAYGVVINGPLGVTGTVTTKVGPGSIRYASQFATLQAAIDDLPSTGGTVFIEAGTYSQTINSTKEGVRLIGLGSPVTNILNQARTVTIQASSGTVIDIGNSASTTHNGWQVENILIRDSAGATCEYGMRIRRMTHCTLRNVGFENFGATNSAALYLDGTGAGGGGLGYTLIEACGIRESASGSSCIGVKLTNTSAVTIIGGQYVGAVGTNPTGKGIEQDSGSDSAFVDSASFEDWATAIELGGNHNVINARIEGQANNGSGIGLLASGQQNIISGSLTGLSGGVTIAAGNNNNTLTFAYSNCTTPLTDSGEANLFVSASRNPQIICNATGSGQNLISARTGNTTTFNLTSGSAGVGLDVSVGSSASLLGINLGDNTGGSEVSVRNLSNQPMARMFSSGDVYAYRSFILLDGVTAHAGFSGFATMYVDAADGDLKIKFSDGVIKTITTDT